MVVLSEVLVFYLLLILLLLGLNRAQILHVLVTETMIGVTNLGPSSPTKSYEALQSPTNSDHSGLLNLKITSPPVAS